MSALLLLQEEGEGEEGEIKDSKKTFNRPVCKYYHRGNCTWGGSCKFVHVGVSDNGMYFIDYFQH